MTRPPNVPQHAPRYKRIKCPECGERGCRMWPSYVFDGAKFVLDVSESHVSIELDCLRCGMIKRERLEREREVLTP